jgi:hypothetical protein
MELFSGRPIQPSWDQFAKHLVTTVAPHTATLGLKKETNVSRTVLDTL